MAFSVTLSCQELCFAVLVESHNVVSMCLFEFVLNAVKASSPSGWKETVCACFGTGVGRYVRQHLENDLPVTDIYAVCRIIRCRINDVAKYCGGNLVNPREKERFSLHIQGVETARHWAFHSNQCVSAAEVCINIVFLTSVLNTLANFCETTSSTDILTDHLSKLLQYAESLETHVSPEEYRLRSTSVGSALLYSSLEEFERSYKQFFNEVPKACGCKERNRTQVQSAEDFPTFMKRVRKALQEKPPPVNTQILPRSSRARPEVEKMNYNAMCKNVLAVRNAWAHSGKLTLSRINEALLDVSNLLKVFGLCHKQTTLAMKGIALMVERESQVETVHCCISQEGSEIPSRVNNCKRILRPRGQHFVGRNRELFSMKSLLAKEKSDGSRAVLILGPAGVGKSYLATEVAHNMINTYSRQTWVSCSDKIDISLALDSVHSKCHNIANGISQQRRSLDIDEIHNPFKGSLSQNEQLFIFDDVCSSTMPQVYEIILAREPSVVITTKSTAVKNFFRHVLPSLYVMHLRPFSMSESWRLAERVVKLADVDPGLVTVVKKTFSEVLGNLPLCVSIYCSLLATALKKNCQTVKHEHINNLAQKQWPWRDVEELFGDHLHVRGLSGVVQCAESHLEDSPLVVLLLAKICSTESESIPWEVLHNTGPTGIQREVFYGQKEVSVEMFLSGLQGITDWLFSDCGQSTMVICRNTLEELGLISWDEPTSTVCIHMLTLAGVREMLKKRCLFLGNLLSRMPLGDQEVDNLAKTASLHLSSELLMQTLSHCVTILHDGVIAVEEVCPQEVAFSVFEFLVKFVNKNVLASPGVVLANPQLTWMRSKLAHTLYEFSKKTYFIEVASQDVLSWAQLSGQSPQVNKFDSWDMRCTCLVTEATDLYRNGMPGRACSKLDILLKEVVHIYGEDSDIAAYVHCMVAISIEKEKGPLARKAYLKRASSLCPCLISEPTNTAIQSAINDTLRASRFIRLRDTEDKRKLFIWFHLIRFQIEPFKPICTEKHKVIILFIILSQQRQNLIIREVTEQRLRTPADKPNSKIMLTCVFLMDEARVETTLWSRMGRRGRALRVLVKTYHVIDDNAVIIAHTSTKQRVSGAFWYKLVELVGELCFHLWDFGNLFAIRKLFKSFLPTEREHVEKETIIQDLPTWDTSAADGQGTFSAECIVHEEIQVLGVLINLFCEVEILRERHDFQGVLDRLITILVELLAFKCTRRFVQSYIGISLHVAIGYIECLSTILGQTRSKDSFHLLLTLSVNSTTPPQWRAVLKNVTARIIARWNRNELTIIFDTITQSRKDVADGANDQHARKGALKCWRELVHVLEELSIKENKLVQEYYTVETLTFMIMKMARILQQLYANKMMFTSARWFSAFRIQLATEVGFFLLVANYSIEWIDFLKGLGHYGEALEQCRLVEHRLVEELGEDYTDWLPDMPNLTVMRRGLEKITGQCENATEMSWKRQTNTVDDVSMWVP